MNRIIWPASAVLIAVILVTGGVLTAHSLRPVAVTRIVPGPRVTITARPAAIVRHVTRWPARALRAAQPWPHHLVSRARCAARHCGVRPPPGPVSWPAR